jgi:hypothetical protein
VELVAAAGTAALETAAEAEASESGSPAQVDLAEEPEYQSLAVVVRTATELAGGRRQCRIRIRTHRVAGRWKLFPFVAERKRVECLRADMASEAAPVVQEDAALPGRVGAITEAVSPAPERLAEALRAFPG